MMRSSYKVFTFLTNSKFKIKKINENENEK